MCNQGDENFSKSFLRIIDSNDDGILTLKEMKDFNACPEYQGNKLMKEFREYGRKADLNELSESLTPKLGILFAIQSLKWLRSVPEMWKLHLTPNTLKTSRRPKSRKNYSKPMI